MTFCGLDGTRLRDQDEDPLVGQTIDRYEVQARIGAGAIGCVYRARHTRLGSEFALKVLFGETASDEQSAARFAREAKAASQLAHPNIVSVVDYGRSAEGVGYIAMELVRGPTLAQLIAAEGPIEPTRAARLLRQLASALIEAHARGLVHRDLKPGNIMVEQREDGENLKVLDFGLVAFAEGEDSRGKLTATGLTVGTPVYMAPEQAHSSQVGPSADLYAIGAIAYEMLSGRPPFTGKAKQVLVQKMSTPAPPLPGTSSLELLIMALLQIAPTDRPADARSVVDALRPLCDSRSAAAVPAPPDDDRNPTPLPSAAAASQALELARPARHLPVLVVAVAVAAGVGVGMLVTGRSDPVVAPMPEPATAPPTVGGSPSPAEPTAAVGPPRAQAPPQPQRAVTATATAPSIEAPPKAAEIAPAKVAAARTRRPRISARATGTGAEPAASFALMEQEIRRTLTARGLTEAEIPLLPAAEKALARWRSTRTRNTEAEQAAALATVLATLQTTPIERALLKAKLDRIGALLVPLASDAPRRTYRALEERYLELTVAASDRRTPANELAALARRVTEFERRVRLLSR